MSEERIIRQLLVEIDRNPSVSQRQLSEDLSVSVGSINWYLKRCVKKGLIKLGQAPITRYLYYLTPEGFAEKTRLTASYLSITFDIFRVGRQQYNALFNLCAVNDWRDIVLLGDSELAELAMLVASQIEGIKIHCVLDPDSENDQCAGLPVKTTIDEVTDCLPNGRVDAIIGTKFDMNIKQNQSLKVIREAFNLDRSRLLIPAFI